MALSAQTIDSFITPGSPLARAGGAQTLLQATGGSLTGAAFLAALARKESEFGRTSGRLGNNLWGWDVHNGRTFPSILEGAQTVWRGLNSGLYKGAGLTTPSAIINRYAPPSENNTALYSQQVGQWFRQLGMDPNTNVFSGARVPVTPGGSNFMVPSASSSAPAAGGLTAAGVPSLTPRTTKAIANYIIASRNDVLAGRTPRDPMKVLGLLVNESQIPTTVAGSPGNVHSAAATPAAGSPLPVQPGSLYGFPTGSVGSGLAYRGGDGGDWGGSMERALALARAVGATPSSQKRSRRLTASGNPSDHWVGSTQSYATDLPTSGSAGDALLKKVSSALGINLRAGVWNNVNIGGYRYQVGWRVPGHFDHIHVGVRRL